MRLLFGIILSLLTCSVSMGQTQTLNHFLEIAQNNSPLLKDLRNQVTANQIDSLRIRAGLKPQVNLNSTGLYAPVASGYGYAPAITNEHTLNALMGISQAIVGKKNIDAQLQAITLQSQSLNNTAKISEQDLKKLIIGQYLTAYGSLQQLKFNQELIDLLNKEEALLKQLTRSNVYRQSDYLTFLVTLKQQELTLAQSRLQYKTDYTTLNYLAGITDTATSELSEPDIHQNILPNEASSIFFAQYRIDSLKLINSRQLVDFSYKPKASILADGGYNSDFSSQAYKNFGVSAGFTFTMPIYDGGQRKMQHRKISLEEQTRQSYKTFFDSQYKQQIAQLKLQINETENLLKKVDEQLKYSESLIKVDNRLLQTGDLRIADLILAISNYFTIRNLRTTTNINKLQLINQLNYWNK
ncbi:TolC family protein [Mucilaginibacter sp. L3T2-6]|uniref:TolC family protein n=1 Tax=Mucilaginibacter sp. L3T2-6 TaxID=3062491 RepID=UPI0026756750|nr:TolC family protein [Mucilaginibacter sp. L3T2-6]MDO3640573.1 TolC family protein [Mucilaginibacter sp. L3T2-6]MDV6213088.1 TolC family protein [Mucilaginibacter sp. L3T2-6]